MNIKFYNNSAESNRVDKTSYLTNELSLTGDLKEGCDLVTPSILISIDNSQTLFTYNYAYIEDFNRYYFITDIVSENTKLWRVTMQCDVLMTYKTTIGNTTALVTRNENTYNTLIEDNRVNFKYNKETIYINLLDYRNESYTYEDLDYQALNVTITHYVNQSAIPITSYGNIISKYPDNPPLYRPNIPNNILVQLPETIDFNNMGYIKDTLVCSYMNDITSFRTLSAYISRKSSAYDFINNVLVSPIVPTYDTGYNIPLTLDSTAVTDKLYSVGSYTALVYPMLFYTQRFAIGTYDMPTLSNFYDFEPYTTYNIYIPFVGLRPISAEDINGKSLTLLYNCNYLTGASTYQLWVSYGNQAYICDEGDASVFTEISLTTTNREEVGNAIVSSLIGASIGAISGGIGISRGELALSKASRMRNSPKLGKIPPKKQYALGQATLDIQEGETEAIGSAVQSFSNFNAYLNKGNTSVSGDGQYIMSLLHPVIIKTYSQPIEYSTTDFKKLNGLPLNEYKVLNTLTGYTECQDFHLENFTTATQNEIVMLDSLLKSGIIL